MEISMIINCGFLGLILFGFLTGYVKGTFRASYRLIFLILLFVALWIATPSIYNAVEGSLPAEFFESIEEYVSREELGDLAPFVLRAFVVPYLWLILAIVTLPIYWIIGFIIKAIIIKKPERPELSEDKAVRKKQIKEYKKSLKPGTKSRLVGSLIGMVTSVSIVFVLFSPVVGVYETLRDDQGNVRCIKVDDFDSCEYTKHYEDSVVSKLFSAGGIGTKMFNLMSSGEAFGVKSSLGEDLNNLVDAYFLLLENGIDPNEDIDYVKVLTLLSADEIIELRGYIESSKFLMSVIDNIGVRILDKELELGTKYGIDVATVSLSKELGIILDVASMLIDLPFTKDNEMNKNYVEILNSVDDEAVEDLLSKLNESDIIDAVMAEYGTNELEKAIVDALKDYNENLELDFSNVDIVDELGIVINAARDLAELDVIYFNEEKGKVAMRNVKTLGDYVTDEQLDGFVADLFESTILTQVVDGVASPLLLDVLNDSLGKEYTEEQLNLSDINWKDELAHDLGLIIDLMETGIMDTIDSGEGNFFTAIADVETKDQLISDMTQSKLLVSLLDVLSPEYINEFATSLTDDPDYQIDVEALNIDWTVELPALVDFVEMLDEGGMFEEEFDFIEYVGSLENVAPNDEVAKLSSAMTASKIVMELVPAIAESSISTIREDVTFDDIEWNDEIEPLLRVIKLFHGYGMFADGADITEVVMDVIEVEENIDLIFESNVMYDIATSTIEEELVAIEVDGAPLLNVGPEGLGLTKEEWKDELELLSSILGDIDAVEDIANIGNMDPELIITTNKLNTLGNMVDTLLYSKIFAEPIANKLHNSLELTGIHDVKTLEELRTASWSAELIAANKVLYEVNAVSDVTVDMVSSLIATAEDTVFVKDLVSDKVKEGLASVEVNNSPAFEQSFIDDLDIYTVDWDAESDLLDGLNDVIDNPPAVVDAAYGAKLDEVLADGKDSTILKNIVIRELRTIIKDNITEAYAGDVSFVDELDVFNMSKYGSSFAQEFSMLDSLEEIASESYEFSVDDLNAFEEGGIIFNVANSVLASNVLDGSDVTLEVPSDIIREIAINKVNEMGSCVSSMDLSNARYGKDVIISLIVVE